VASTHQVNIEVDKDARIVHCHSQSHGDFLKLREAQLTGVILWKNEFNRTIRAKEGFMK
jgi:hypothetical protein